MIISAFYFPQEVSTEQGRSQHFCGPPQWSSLIWTWKPSCSSPWKHPRLTVLDSSTILTRWVQTQSCSTLDSMVTPHLHPRLISPDELILDRWFWSSSQNVWFSVALIIRTCQIRMFCHHHYVNRHLNPWKVSDACLLWLIALICPGSWINMSWFIANDFSFRCWQFLSFRTPPCLQGAFQKDMF